MDANLFNISDFRINDEDDFDIGIKRTSNDNIAIIGIALKMPCAETLYSYWEIIKNGIDCVRELPAQRKRDEYEYLRFRDGDGSEIKFLPGAFLEDIDKFDFSFFNITPKEASLMNPLQRLFLQVAYNAVEDAGYGGRKLAGSNTGVYLGFISDLEGYKYKEMIHQTEPHSLPISTAGNLSSITAGRISYMLDLKGPSMLVDTACSSSLVAVHLACTAMRKGECDMAIAGGARINMHPLDREHYKIGIESSDGLTRTFDDDADGSGMGEGIIALLLKPLSRARKDRDHIYAVIKGSAVNQDGNSMGITAPNAAAHANVILAAWKNAGINPETLSYIEAHGTATRLGDPIELEGLTKAFAKYTDKNQFCALSSIKSNIGHLYDCAGLAGMVKAILSLKHRYLPPSIHFYKPSRKINFFDTPFYINTKGRYWENGNTPRRCGISSFGIGGTNCHLILEEAAGMENNKKRDSVPHFLALSAKSREALNELLKQYAEFTGKNELEPEEACYTAATGRVHHGCRLALVFRNTDDLRYKLARLINADFGDISEAGVKYGESKPARKDIETEESGNLSIQTAVDLNLAAGYKAGKFNAEGRSNEELLNEIGELYVKGADIDWEEFYRGRDLWKASVPGYQFERKRCWIDIPSTHNSLGGVDSNQLYYGIKWIPAGAAYAEPLKDITATLVFHDGSGANKQTEEILTGLEAHRQGVCHIKIGDDFEKIDEQRFTVGDTVEDYEKLMLNFREEQKLQIIYLNTLSDDGGIEDIFQLERSQKIGVYSLLKLSRAIANTGHNNIIRIALVAKCVYEVTGKEAAVHPQHAPLFGMGRVLQIENPLVKCKCIDTDEQAPANDILDELELPYNEYLIAFRDGERYVECFDSVDIDNVERESIEIREDGVYVITGGTGGIGLEIARYLVEKKKVNLALLSRSKIPDQSEWGDILKQGESVKLCSRIKRLMPIEERAKSLMYLSADVSDVSEVSAALESIRLKYGKINGIIHGAGVGRFNQLQEVDEDSFNEVFYPKVYGTWILDELTRADNLDFFILFSSVATAFSASGQGDYVAANSFLDCYPAFRNRSGRKTLSINWTTWKEVGMAADYGFNIDTIFKAVSIDTAVGGFDKVIHRRLNRVFIGQLDYSGPMVFLLEKYPICVSDEIKRKLEKSKESLRLKNKAVPVRKTAGEIKLKGRKDERYSGIEKKLASMCKEVLGYSEIDIYESFFELGADSILLKKLHSQLEAEFPGVISIADLFGHPSVSRLSKFISEKFGDAGEEVPQKDTALNERLKISRDISSVLGDVISGKIDPQKAVQYIEEANCQKLREERTMAIIGIALKLPMADSLDEYWNVIKNRIECISCPPEGRKADIENYLLHKELPIEGVRYADAAYVNEIDKFDPGFFRISPREASLMDPSQRLFLETAWNAMEDAGYGGEKLRGSNTGVFVGFANNLRDSYGRLFYEDDYLEPTSIVGNMSAILPGRVSYMLDLKGPSMVIDTACSSSLVAVDLACRSIRSGECDMAIAGGVKLNVLPVKNENESIGIESGDGRTRTFDENSDGSGIGEGVAAVLIKNFNKAVEDGDSIYAVIKGSAVNQDGETIGLTAPNPAAQADLIERAWKNADVNPETITYIETHGTATNIGDPVEIQGIQNAFQRYTDKKQFCAVGSVKTNIGHLFEAAGIANLIKAVLAIKNKKLPPTINFYKPNSKINFDQSPVYVNTRLRDWETDGFPRRCGVSSFGFGGTNSHVILEEPPEDEVRVELNKSRPNIFTLSAKSEDALIELVRRHLSFANKQAALNLDSLCYTVNTGRGHYNFRLALIAKDGTEYKNKLDRLLDADFNSLECEDIFYGFHKLANQPGDADEGIITESERLSLSNAANLKIKQISENDGADREALREICRLYIKGAELEWHDLWQGLKIRKMHLPGYPFEKRKCWVRFPEVEDIKDTEPCMYYTMEWTADGPDKNNEKAGKGIIVLFKDIGGISVEVAALLRDHGRKVIEVEIGNRFKKLEDGGFLVGASEEDYIRLISSIKTSGVEQIVHMSTLRPGHEGANSREALESSQTNGVYSLFYLVRALLKNEVKNKIDIVLVSDYVSNVTGAEEKISPENATLFGLGRVIGQEYLNIACRCMDVDRDISAADILNELNAEAKSYVAAYRRGMRYVEEFMEADIHKYKEEKFDLKEEGVYVITGGTGGIGLEIAKWLACRKKVNLALVSRSRFPEKKEWDEILDNKKEGAKLRGKLRQIKEIEQLGGRVEFICADISNLSQLEAAFDGLRNRYGRINGIIHSAGIPGDGFIINKKEEAFREVLLPKVWGTWNLDHVTKDDLLDFFVCFSSGLSMLGEPGQGDYVAANSYMDSFTALRNKKGKRTLTIDWVSWKSAGMSVEYGFNVDKIFKAIPTEQALNSFSEVMCKSVQRILIGELNYTGNYVQLLDELPFRLSDRIAEKVEKTRIYLEKRRKGMRSRYKGAITLKGKPKEAITEVDKVIGSIWGEVLGIDEINVHDSFYDLGGDSMLSMRLLKKLEKEYSQLLALSLTDIYTYSTIDQMSRYISGKLTDGGMAEEEVAVSYPIDEDAGITLECIPRGMLTSNCYVLGSCGEGVLIDAGSSSEKIMKVIERNGLSLKYIIITHAHIDHMLSMDEIKQKTGASILIHENEKELLQDCLGARLIDKSYQLKEDDRFLRDGDIVKTGDLELEIIHTPGHTKGCVCVKMGNIIFSGDTLLKMSAGKPDNIYGSESELKNSIGKLMKFDDAVVLYPGHGEPTSIGQERRNNPFVLNK